jgi:hypothetical protein
MWRGSGSVFQVSLRLIDYLTISVGALALVLAACAFVYVRRLEKRPRAALGEKLGAHKAVLAKLRKRQPLSSEELGYAEDLISDARSPLALTMPATIFTMGLFYIVGSYQQLHGAHATARTFIGLIPMMASTNMFVQLVKVAKLKVPEPSV